MKVVTEAKTKEEALKKALDELKVNENEIFYKEENIKGKLFKSGSVKIYAYTDDEILESIKKFITEIVTNMGLEVNFETNTRDKGESYERNRKYEEFTYETTSRHT